MSESMRAAPAPTTELADLAEVRIPSELYPSVSYRMERCIGIGAMGVAYFALRHAPEGIAPVVIKVIRPSVLANLGAAASLMVQKEAVALGRLNESVPPTPFVVRFIDTGSVRVRRFPDPLPWIALEYIHGGAEGTTLEDRVRYSCEQTGYAFDTARAAHVIRSLASGLSAIHAVGVIHRDLTPSNVLCCGFGEAEIFKISDFGIARPVGMALTFGAAELGTLGYGAPELTSSDPDAVGPWSDVFSFATVVYYVLTGQDYFDTSTQAGALLAIQRPERPRLRHARHLTPELRERTDAREAIDAALSRATAADREQRPQSAQQLAAGLLSWLGERSPRPSRRLMDSLLNLSSPAEASTWTWVVRHAAGDDRVVRSAAWDGDGRCFAATTHGLEFWNGTAWVDAEKEAPSGARFAHRFDAGRWLVGGDDATLAVYGSEGVREVARAPDRTLSFSDASGRFEDLLAAVAQRPGAAPELWAMAARRWMKPVPLPAVSYVAALLRLDHSRWIVCGRLREGAGFAAIYTPMQWEIAFLLTPRTRAFIGGASLPERGLALIVGSDGVAVRVEADQPTASVAEGFPDLTAAAMDVLGREWVASVGRLWVRDSARDMRWRCVWHDPTWTVPFVSLMADAGVVFAMTADGGVLEGRAPWRSAGR